MLGLLHYLTIPYAQTHPAGITPSPAAALLMPSFIRETALAARKV
jgi:hypothetical protein